MFSRDALLDEDGGEAEAPADEADAGRDLEASLEAWARAEIGLGVVMSCGGLRWMRRDFSCWLFHADCWRSGFLWDSTGWVGGYFGLFSCQERVAPGCVSCVRWRLWFGGGIKIFEALSVERHCNSEG